MKIAARNLSQQSSVTYSRVSSKEQQEGYSIAAQQSSMQEYAKRLQLSIVEQFTDIETAKKAGRTQFGLMLAFLDSHPEVKTILVEKTDRLYRNLSDYLVLDELIKGLDLKVHLVKEGQILSKESRSDARFIHGLNVLQAKKYSENLSEEVKKGQLQKAKQGKYPGGCVAIGYVLDKNTDSVSLDPHRAPIVAEIFEKYAERRWSMRALANWSGAQGLTTSRLGKPITSCQIERILKNPFYYGEFRWAGRVFQGSHVPLISKKLFDQVKQTLTSHNKVNPDRHRFAFGSLLVCANCGCTITAELRKNKYTYYHCTGMRGGCKLVYVPETELVSQFTKSVYRISIRPTQTAEILEGLEEWTQSSNGGHEAKKSRIQARMTQLDVWTEKAYLDKLEGKITEEQWQNLTRKWNDEQAACRSSMRTSDKRDELFYTAKELLELVEVIPALWDTRKNEDKREMIDLLYWNSTLEGATLRAAYRKPFNHIVEGHVSEIWRPRPHSPQTFAEFEFTVKCSYVTKGRTRWKSIN